MNLKNILVLTVMILLSATVSSAAIIDIPALGNGDGYFNDTRDYDSFNSTADFISAHYQFWGSSDDVSTNTGYIQYALGSAPAAASISSVTLFGYFNSSYLTSPTPNAGSVYHVSNASGATGNASQKLNGNELVTTVDAGMTGWNSVDVTDYVLNDIISGYNWSAFSFRPNTTGIYNNRYAGYRIASAESGKASYLRFDTGTTSAVPEPASLFLLVSGLAGFIFRKFKA